MSAVHVVPGGSCGLLVSVTTTASTKLLSPAFVCRADFEVGRKTQLVVQGSRVAGPIHTGVGYNRYPFSDSCAVLGVL